MLLKLFREGLGRLVILVSMFIPTGRLQRSPEQQVCVDRETSDMSLYEFYACPFCLKTRRALKRLGLTIATRNAQKNPDRADLLAGGGEIKVPCLRLHNPQTDKSTWMYESSDIIAYLEQRFGEHSDPCQQTTGVDPSGKEASSKS